MVNTITTHFYVGPAAPDLAQAALAAAQHYAAAGQPTLLLSPGPAHYLPLTQPPSLNPYPHAPLLDLLAFDAQAALAAAWQQGRDRVPAALRSISDEELPLVPGSTLLLAFQRLAELQSRYAQVVIAAGTHETLIEALALVDSLRWGVRLLVGGDDRQGESASNARALLPVHLLPFDLSSGAQALRLQAESARDRLIDSAHSRAVFVLPTSALGLREPQIAIAALQLFGVLVDAIVVGPLGASDQAAALEQAHAIWPQRPILAYEGDSEMLGAALAAIAPQPLAPIRVANQSQPTLLIDLPGMPRGVLKLTLSGNELIIRIGGYRRHLLLPEQLRGITQIKATRDGDTLAIRQR